MFGDLPTFDLHETARFQGQMHSVNDLQRMQQLPISAWLRSSVEGPVFQYELPVLTYYYLPLLLILSSQLINVKTM